MSTRSADNDLQTYLDSFNEDIEEGSESIVTLKAETVDALTNGNEAVQTIFRETNEVDSCDEIEEHNEEPDDAIYFLDSEKNLQESERLKVVRRGAKSSTKNDVIMTKIEEDMDESDVEYVVILEDDNKAEVSTDDANNSNDFAMEHDKEVYEFAENDETINAKEKEKSLIVNRKVITTKNQKEKKASDMFQCTYCNYTAPKRHLLSRHLISHSDYRPYKCSVCERGFKKSAALRNHINVHLGNKPHQCKSCEMAFTTSGELLRHVRYRHTKEKPHKCTECEYSSVEVSKLTRHMRCHTGERPYQCPHCTYASPDSFKLKRHLRTHTGEKPYECTICHARFTQSNSLKSHLLIHSVGNKPVFQCELCPTTCGRKTDLRAHIKKLHHSDKPIKCKRCAMELPDRYSYKLHIKTHDGEKCFKCNYCPYRSFSKKQLESHMLIHTDKKPFNCDVCGTSFRSRQLLIRHTNIYHNHNYSAPLPREKKHTCPHCERKFTHKGNLMRHMELHDPDPNLQKEKLKLKIGRLTRVHADGSIVTIANDLTDNYDGDDADVVDDVYEDDESKYEYIETAEYEFDEKPVLSSIEDSVNVKRNIISIKNKRNQKERYMTLEDEDHVVEEDEEQDEEQEELEHDVEHEDENGEEYVVVKVIQCDDDEIDEDDENIITIENISKSKSKNVSKISEDDCFGFEEDVVEYIEDQDTKERRDLADIMQL